LIGDPSLADLGGRPEDRLLVEVDGTISLFRFDGSAIRPGRKRLVYAVAPDPRVTAL
jgi:hypothetical protein